MAEVYRFVNGMKLEKLIALTAEAQAGLSASTEKTAAAAKAILASHRHEGHSRIEVEDLGIDRMITLNDERGQKAAMTIEFGRRGGGKNGAMEPVAPLRKAIRKNASRGR